MRRRDVLAAGFAATVLTVLEKELDTMATLDGKLIEDDELDCAKEAIAIFVATFAVNTAIDIKDAAEKGRAAIRALRLVKTE